MPDYNLGRATGQIIITSDTSGADKAAAAMAGVSAESDVLNRNLGKQQEHVSATQIKHLQLTSALQGHQAQLGKLSAEYNKYTQEIKKASDENVKQQALFKKATAEGKDFFPSARAAKDAQADQAKYTALATKAHQDYQSVLAKVNLDQAKLNVLTQSSTKHIINFSIELDKTKQALESVSSSMAKFLAMWAKMGAMGMAGVGGAGGIGLLAGGAGQGIVAVALALQQLSGAIALLPAVVGGAVVSMAALKLGVTGVSEAFKSFDDPAKFAAALRTMSPAARSVMTDLRSFSNAFRGVKMMIQESLFAPLVADIKPLVSSLLPVLMRGLQEVAGVFGQIGHQIAVWLQLPSTMGAISTFIHNIAQGLKSMAPAVVPILNAFKTLSVVGSSVFSRLGSGLTDVANRFNNWVTKSAENGSLLAWINRALDAFTKLGHIISNFGAALTNMMKSASTAGGGGFLSTLEGWTAQFKAFTESAKGQTAMADFFKLLHETSQALSPILKEVAKDIGILFTGLAKTGIGIAPGFLIFFKLLGTALSTLAPYLVKAAPAFNQFAGALGGALIQIVQKIGPALPKLLQSFADVLTTLAPVLVTVAGALIEFLGSFTQGDIEVIGGITLAVWLLNAALAFNPWVILAASIAALIAGLAYAYEHFKGFRDGVDGIWTSLKEFASWVSDAFSHAWDNVVHAWDNVVHAFDNIKNAWNDIKSAFGDAYDWGRSIVQRLIDGVRSMAQPFIDVWDFIMGHAKDRTSGNSPIPKGPLSGSGDTYISGQNITARLASGIASGGDAVSAASDSVAGNVASSFSSAGGTFGGGGGTSGTGGAGHSGFDQYINSLTTDMSAWSKIFHDGFDVFKNAADVGIQGIKIVASLWNKGDNPMTRAGGIAGPPKSAQTHIPGVPDVELPGVAPLPELVPKGASSGWQNTIAGIPNVPAPNATPNIFGTIPGQAAITLPPGSGPAGQNGSAGAPAPSGSSTAGPTGMTPDQIAQSIITQGQAAGMNPDQIKATLAVGLQETGLGTNPRTNVVQNQNGTPGIAGVFQQDSGYDKYGNKLDPNIAAKGFIDQYVHTGQGLNNPNPYDQALQVQRPALVGNHGYDDRQTNHPGSYLKGQQGQQASDIYDRLSKSLVPGSGIIDTSAGPIALSDASAPLSPPGGGFIPQSYGLHKGTDTGGYGTGSTKQFPQWMVDLGAQYGVIPSTYPDHQESDRGGEAGYAPNPQHQNRGVDWVGTPAQMEAFAKALTTYGGAEGKGGGLEQVIYQAGSGGTRYGLGGAGNVNNIPHEQGGYYPQSGDGSYDEHGGGPTGAHVHTRFSASIPLLQDGSGTPGPAQVQGQAPPVPQSIPGTNLIPNTSTSGVLWADAAGNRYSLVDGKWTWTIGPKGVPHPPDPTGPGAPLPGQRVAPGIAPPPLVDFSKYPDGTQQPNTTSASGPGVIPGGGPANAQRDRRDDLSTGQIAKGGAAAISGANPATSTKSPLDVAEKGLSAAGTIAGDAFAVVDDVITNIGAATKMMDTLIRGPENTEDVVKFIQNIQTFIKTAADIAKTVGDVGSLVGGAAGGADMGIGSAIGAIGGLISSALTAVNAGISMGIEVYHEVTKYMGILFSFNLGAGPAGALAGNVKMLLNTATGELSAYSEDNPLNKNVLQTPSWLQKSYTPGKAQNTQATQLNIYAGPGQSTQQMMSDSMWLIKTGAPSVASVSGHE